MQNEFLKNCFDFIKKIGLKKILYIILAISTLIIILLCVMLKKMSYTLIETHLSNFLGLKIELIQPNTYFDTKLNLISKAKTINVYDKTKSKKFITIEEPNIAIKPFFILFKKINIKNLSAKNVLITVAKDKDNKIDILESLNLKNLQKINIQNFNITRLISNVEKITFNFEDKSDTRSSNYLEDAATEIQVQGLELDYACVLWDADMRCENNQWAYYKFNGKNKWNPEKNEEQRKYMLNAYRVLLTRARQGIVICVPEGNSRLNSEGFPEDATRLPKFYDGTYEYLKNIGIKVI